MRRSHRMAATTHEIFCPDKVCASHEFCGETEANGLGCLCHFGFAAPYRQNKTFGDATTCYRNSASVSLINCLLMERGFDYTTLHLKDPKCKGELQDGMVTFSFNNTEMCKAEVMDSDTQVIYTNIISTSESNGSIIRMKWHLTFLAAMLNHQSRLCLSRSKAALWYQR
ncbi:uncharacterized protein [Labrus bergylta]|uniref:uncharacterized protein n=1 Tax=Labrus bergylta TaxID=56723 RepID=UPI003313B905